MASFSMIALPVAFFVFSLAMSMAGADEDIPLLASGKRQHSMLRFGKRPSAGHALLHFGKREEDSPLIDYLQAGLERPSRGHAIMRFGKRGANGPSGHSMLYFGKRPHAMIHFGKRDPESEDEAYWMPEEEKRGGEGRSHAMIHFGKRTPDGDDDEMTEEAEKKDGGSSKNVFLRFG